MCLLYALAAPGVGNAPFSWGISLFVLGPEKRLQGLSSKHFGSHILGSLQIVKIFCLLNILGPALLVHIHSYFPGSKLAHEDWTGTNSNMTTTNIY